MPWFDPILTSQEESDFIEPGGSGIPHKVGRWPAPNTDRVDARYIMRHMDPLAHTAYRRLFCVSTVDTSDFLTFPEWSLFGHWDIEVIAEDHLQQTVTANVHGWDLIVDFQSFDVLPFKGNPGIEVKFKITHDASGHWHQKTFEFDHGVMPFTWNTIAAGTGVIQSETTESPDFPYNFVKFFDWPMSDCFLFERATPAPTDFAVFNGVDSYIKNRSITTDDSGSWRQEFDIRLHTTDFNHYLCKSFNTTRFCVIRFSRIQYINRVVEFTTDLNLDQWYHIDFRYQWVTTDGLYRVSVDGGPDDTAANSGRVARWDQFGKRGSQAPVGEFDMKNFVYTKGPSSSPVVALDQKFQADACDDGPDGRDGDTFNMTLPSCP